MLGKNIKNKNMEQYLITIWPEAKSKPKKRFFRRKKVEPVIDIEIDITIEEDDIFYCPYLDKYFIYI